MKFHARDTVNSIRALLTEDANQRLAVESMKAFVDFNANV